MGSANGIYGWTMLGGWGGRPYYTDNAETNRLPVGLQNRDFISAVGGIPFIKPWVKLVLDFHPALNWAECSVVLLAVDIPNSPSGLRIACQLGGVAPSITMSNTLFSQSFLEAGLQGTAEYRQISPQLLAHFGQDLRAPYAFFRDAFQASNEAQIEDALIRPVLNSLGWSYLAQQPIPLSGKTPDYMLFTDDDDRAAFTDGGDISRYPLAPAEAKAWGTNLDQRAGALSPSAQIQDYLRQFWQSTGGRVKWGILTNGETWRLYRATGTGPDGKFYQAQDVWFELKLSECVSDAGKEQRRQFLLLFHRDAFRIRNDGYCFLDRALSEAGNYIQTVVDTLTNAVFKEVYPQLLSAFYHAAPDANPDDIQEASLTLLYRLLFLMYAEDRRLLPTEHPAYSSISLHSLRREILERLKTNPTFIPGVVTYWPQLRALFDRIDAGEPAAALPAYNGGLFDNQHPELLARVSLPDDSVAAIINSLGAAAVNGSAEKVLVNFRDLSVEQLGTLYEQLLERRPVIQNGKVEAQLQPYARKDTGSYYTPPELVRLIVEQTLAPLVAEREDRFRQLAVWLASDTRDFDTRRRELIDADPAEAVLQLKALDPAMGSGHFLVDALNYLTGEIDRLAGLGAEVAGWLPEDNPYVSPLEARIANIRDEIQRQAAENDWEVNADTLTDRAIVRRMALKRCIYGVDLNPLAVELAKMSLWLHSFTVGAPLSFLDHHLRCGDSLVGGWLAQTAEDIRTSTDAFAGHVFAGVTAAAEGIRTLEQLGDAEIAEVKESAALFRSMQETVAPVRRMLNFFTGLRWMAAGTNDRPLALRKPRQLRSQIGEENAAGIQWWTVQDYNDLIRLVQAGPDALSDREREAENFDSAGFDQFIDLWRRTQVLAAERRMLHWELDFPGVFTDWLPRSGGFDAVIGNPPWERVKLQAVEWFAPETRRPAIASATPAARRRTMIAQLQTDADPLHGDYAEALDLADTMLRYGRACGDYPLLGGGDTNLYRLFVECGTELTDRNGVMALLTPSGIYGDKSAASFFGGVAGKKRLLALYDFENRRGLDTSGKERGRFFADVHPQFKFCTLVMGGPERTAEDVPCGFLLHDPPDVVEPERLLTIQASDFALVNPKTGTAPIFLTRRDADIVLDIYRNNPVFDAENQNFENATAVVRHVALAHMTNDSGHFRTQEQMEADGWYPVGLNRWRKGKDETVPLYQGRTIHQFDHRYNSVGFKPDNLHNPYVNDPVTVEQHANPQFHPRPRYWVSDDFVRQKFLEQPGYAIGFRDISNPTNERTMIATIVPWSGYSNKVPLLVCNDQITGATYNDVTPLWTGNFASFAFDFVVKRKMQSTNINLYILEQFPIITRADYDRRFGSSTTAAELVRDHVLRLCYTAYDLQPFARAQGYDGEPFGWDVEERRHLRARLDALYFILYGLDRDDAAYVMDSFSITRRHDEQEHNGVYVTKELILRYMNALEAGDTERVVALPSS